MRVGDFNFLVRRNKEHIARSLLLRLPIAPVNKTGGLLGSEFTMICNALNCSGEQNPWQQSKSTLFVIFWNFSGTSLFITSKFNPFIDWSRKSKYFSSILLLDQKYNYCKKSVSLAALRVKSLPIIVSMKFLSFCFYQLSEFFYIIFYWQRITERYLSYSLWRKNWFIFYMFIYITYTHTCTYIITATIRYEKWQVYITIRFYM